MEESVGDAFRDTGVLPFFFTIVKSQSGPDSISQLSVRCAWIAHFDSLFFTIVKVLNRVRR